MSRSVGFLNSLYGIPPVPDQVSQWVLVFESGAFIWVDRGVAVLFRSYANLGGKFLKIKADEDGIEAISLRAEDVSAEPVGTAIAAISTHITDIPHGPILHTNRDALDVVTGVNTGDKTLSDLGGVSTSKAIAMAIVFGR